MNLPPSGAHGDEREIEAVVAVMRGNPTLDIGEATEALEQRTAELLSKQHGLMVNSGSSALRIAIDLLHLERGDEILTSPLCFSTDIAPMVQSGIVPVFADITPNTYQIDTDGIEAMIGPRTKAILVPNLCGNCPDWDAIRAVADTHGLMVIEDSADVLDSWQRGTRTGTRSDITITSYARSHAMTAGGTGGLVGVNDPDLYNEALSLRRWGRRSEEYLFGTRKDEGIERFGSLADGTPYDLIFTFDTIGYNFEPNELSAAYGLVQIDKLPGFNEQRRSNWAKLNDHVAERDGVTGGDTTEDTDTTWMRFCFTLDDDFALGRNEVQQFLAGRGVSTRMVWTGNILRQPAFAEIEHRQPEGGLPNCDRMMDRSLALPIYHALNADHMGYICEQVDELLATVS
ncbi:MAG: aminotransferase class I/II-fold pyridoxal phosphate-dependent enzyme [Acidimicrobiales bacterium]|nr:aminotransferase class I/II-fold pyridoxal phosphate-dependent enzyme [Acidimicrobiales bacterium]